MDLYENNSHNSWNSPAGNYMFKITIEAIEQGVKCVQI